MRGRRKCPRSFLFPRKMEDGAFHSICSTIEEGERLQIFMKSNVLTIANKSSFRKGDVKDYEEKSDRFSSRGRQKLQLKQVLSLISFLPSPSSLSRERENGGGYSQIYLPRRVYSRRFRFPNGVRATSARKFPTSRRSVDAKRKLIPRYPAIMIMPRYRGSNHLTRVTSYYSGLDIVNPQK